MGLAMSIRRILAKWEVLVCWFRERTAKAIRDKAKDIPAGFPLTKVKQTVEQILSLLAPIETVNKLAQCEGANQVDVLVQLYTLRTGILNLDAPIKHFASRKDHLMMIEPTDLTPTAKNTRVLLQQALYKNFFKSYVDRKCIANGAFIFEIQQLLHPAVKHVGGPMDEIIAAVARQQHVKQEEIPRHVVRVRGAVIGRIKKLMMVVAKWQAESSGAQDPQVTETNSSREAMTNIFNADVMSSFNIRQAPPPVTAQTLLEQRIDEEIDNWFQDPSVLGAHDGMPESMLQYWQHQYKEKTYRYLPQVARIVFSTPTSSAQIERTSGIVFKWSPRSVVLQAQPT